MDEYDISTIATEAPEPDAQFAPFGTPVTVEDVQKCLSGNLYTQLSEKSDTFVLDAVGRAQTYIGAVLSYLGADFNLDSSVVRQVVLMQTVYELHMALGHEEAGREYRIQAKNTIIAAYGAFPDSDDKTRGTPQTGAVSHRHKERPSLYRRALKLGERHV